MCWMVRWTGAAGAATWAAGVAAALVAALLGAAGCWFSSLARSAAPGRSCAPAGAAIIARQIPAEVARNNLLLRRNVRIPGPANSLTGSAYGRLVFRKDSAEPGHSRSSGA